MSASKTRDNRKTKTSILFQIRQNNVTDQNIQIGQSINIISLNTPAKYNKRNGSENCMPKNQNNSTTNLKPNIKRAHQSSKLTIKLGSGGNLIQQQNKGMSVHNKRIDLSELMDKYTKRHLITVQKNRIWSDISSFSSICLQFVEKIDTLCLQNNELNSKIKKFESYFKQVKAKQTTEVVDYLMQNTIKNEKNTQLKILNMERKIETLNYIVKNYRSNNKEQIKEFQKKINQYRPTIEGQLAELLSAANKKNEEMEKMIEYFQNQWGKYYKDGNWVDIVSKLQSKDEQIQILRQKCTNIERQAQQLKVQEQLAKHYKQQGQKIKKQVRSQCQQIQLLKSRMQKLEEQKTQRQQDYDQLLRNQQELTYRIEALLPLEGKIKQKQEQNTKNLLMITRIQNENFVLRNKISSINKNTHTQIFNNQSESIQAIQKCNTTIQQLTDRFSQEIEGLLGVNRQLSSFILHLYEKTKNQFQKIVDQYHQQLKEQFIEIKELKNRLNCMIATNKRKFQLGEEIMRDLCSIDAKKKRCIENQSKIQVNQSCPGCMNWLLNCGQINNLYDQLQVLVKKFRQME